tara:strand:- start:2400 stop:2624 length:225 start_codon:yes stop_codon:yes gene_type:complete
MSYQIESIFEYLSSPEGLNKIVLVIILFAGINSIFIFYALRKSIDQIKEENKKRKIQKNKIDRLYPSSVCKNET